MLAFNRISDFKGTSDKREFQPYVVMFIISLLIVDHVSAGPIGLIFKLVGLFFVLLPLPALMTRRLRDLEHLTMGKVWLCTVAVSLLFLILNGGLMSYSTWMAIAVIISSFVVIGLGAAMFLLCFFKSSKVKAEIVKK